MYKGGNTITLKYLSLANLAGNNEDIKVGFCVAKFNGGEIHAILEAVLHPEEQLYYYGLKSERRQKSYLLGRYCAKEALSLLYSTDRNSILISSGVFNQPVVNCHGNPNLQVSITHSENMGVAVAFPEPCPIGVDLELIDESREGVLERALTPKEIVIARQLPGEYFVNLTQLWTVKEALSKAMRVGFTVPFSVFEISNFEVLNRGTNFEHNIFRFTNFGVFKAISINLIKSNLAIVIPKKFELNLDIPGIREFI